MIDINQLRQRIREHAAEASDCDTLCGDCGATLTETDRAAGECTQCRAEANGEGTDE